METGQPSIREKVQEGASRVTPQIDHARESLGELNTKVLAFVRQQPGTCLLGALALGFVIGRIASR